MTIRSIRVLMTLGTLFLLIPISLIAQFQRDVVPLRPWPAPSYWQPTETENRIAATPATFGNEVAEDTRPANSLVFVGVTPCRVVDTRTGQGFTGAFGPPSLVGGGSRTFPIQSSTTCSIPAIAQAYSFNITVVPPGFLDYITVWPTGQPRPNASTLNGYVNTVIANAAIVPAGTSGSVDVYASQNTNLIIDINGYYAQQTGITLTQGTGGAPSMSFTGDPGTGIFSSGAGALNFATSGIDRMRITPAGRVGIGTTTPGAKLDVEGGSDHGIRGITSADGGIGVRGISGNGSGVYGESSFGYGVYGASNTNIGVYGISGTYFGVFGSSSSGYGVYGISNTDTGVYGRSNFGYAGYFYGDVHSTGVITQNSDARLKKDVASLSHALPEVMRLRPVTFTWKEKPEQGVQLGLIAQEVETVLPELVTTDKDAEQTKGLNYIGLVPVTIKALQEQQAQIEGQQQRIAEQREQILEQQERNRKLEARLAALEELLSANVQSSAGNQ